MFPAGHSTRTLIRGALLVALVPALWSGDAYPESVPAPERQGRYYQVPYNGHFTFTRLRYPNGSWSHDYPSADQNIQLILEEFTALRPNTEGSNVLDLEDPRIFEAPLLYMSEPGYWRTSDEGAQNLRQFLLKGGFLIFDDFEEGQWYNMAEQMRRAMPEYDWFEIDGSHPIFQSYFRIADIYVPHPLVSVTPNYQAMFEDNDPMRRMMVLANHNSDLAEYWEYAGGRFGMDPTNEAFRLGVNYVLYTLMH